MIDAIVAAIVTYMIMAMIMEFRNRARSGLGDDVLRDRPRVGRPMPTVVEPR